VAAEILSGGGRPLIHEVLPRRSKFGRKVAADESKRGDCRECRHRIRVMALDGDFNIRRLERFWRNAGNRGPGPSLFSIKPTTAATSLPASRK